MQAHSLYKKLKLSLDEIKVMIAERTEIEANRRQLANMQKESQAKELKHI